MITPQIEEKTKLITEEIEKSDLGVEEKTQFIELINTSKATCNGLSTEEKIQGLAENNFQTNCILARITMLLKEKRATTWKDVAIRALNSWHLVVMVGFLTALFAFRPEIAEVLKAFAH